MKKIYLVITLLFVFASTTLLIAQNVDFVKTNFPGKEKEFKAARKNVSQGKKYYYLGRGMYMVALEYFLKAQTFNPNNTELNYLIGDCYLNTVQKNKAIDFLEKSISLNPSLFKDNKYLLAQAYQLALNFDKAKSLYAEYKNSLSPGELNVKVNEIEKKVNECNSGVNLVKNPVRVFIDNLGPEINTIDPEYSPFTNADETVLFFTSRRANTNGGKIDENDLRYFEDIYFSEKTSIDWPLPKNPPRPLNSKQHDAPVGLSPDGQTLLTYKGINGGDIYECKLKGTSWSKPKKLNKNINTPDHESSGTISFDGKTLYFVSNKPKGYGGSDIYISTKTKKGEWGKPVNIGSTINTPYDEEGVFIHPDGRTLYFSSQGHNSMGGYDIFKTTLENGIWSEPVNLGYPINTPDNDVFFSMSASGVHGYYSSVKPDGYGGQDIYLITFLGAEKPLINNTEDNLLACLTQPVSETVIEKSVDIKENQITIIKGKVLDDISLQPIGATIEITDNAKNEVVAEFESNSATGKYLLSLPSGKNYGITVKSAGYLFHSENLNIPPATIYQEIEKDIKLKKMEVGSTIVLNNIFFDFNKSTLRDESFPELERLLKLMNDFPTLKIEISGHTDNRGTAAYNKPLSENRAKSVVDYLVGKGINKDRLTFMGYGFDKPVASNDNDEGRQLNRRTEFKIISK
jgi:outer membrane protein OmpA-like peptidoglycan-associated protein